MNEWLEPISAAITAAGTLVLGLFTIVLARQTKRLADVGEQPNIVVTFEPNRHSIIHLDMHVENTGTATAYDIQVSFSPELRIQGRDASRPIPLRNISLLKSGQAVYSSLCSYGELETKCFTVTTSWRRRPSKAREELSYTVDIELMEGTSHLGGDPTVMAARATREIADEIGKISRGYSKLSVNTFDSTDREEESRQLEERFNQQREGL